MLQTEFLVKNALAETLNFSNISTIESTHRLKDDLQLDSMSSLMFLMKLEESIEGFYVDPETLKMKDLETVSSVTNYINTQIYSRESHVH
jgi:acyl carrier protein